MDKIVPQREGTITDYTGKEEAICGKRKNPYGLPASGQPKSLFFSPRHGPVRRLFYCFKQIIAFTKRTEQAK